MLIAGLYNLKELEQIKRAVEEVGEYVCFATEIAPGHFNVETIDNSGMRSRAAKVVGDTVEVF